MFSRKSEMTVGVFMAAGIAALIYLSVTLGNVTLFGGDHYSVAAYFNSITGLKHGATVEIAGVQVGKVTDIALEDDMAKVELDIDKDVKISYDSMASIRTKGIIGEKFIKLTPGGAPDYLADGDVLIDTESAISIEELISKYIFEQ